MEGITGRHTQRARLAHLGSEGGRVKGYTEYKITAPAMKHRNGLKAPQTKLRVFLCRSVTFKWAEVRPLIACAFRHVQKEAFRKHGVNFITRCNNNTTELHLNRGKRFWWGRNVVMRSRVFVGPLHTTPKLDTYSKFKDMPEFWIADWQEHLIALVAHEMWHRWQSGSGRSAEELCELMAIDAVDAWRKEAGYTFTPPPAVHLEDDDLQHVPAENCTDCRQPTRYWLSDKHTPLCPDCCAKRNASYVGVKYFKKTVSENSEAVPSLE